MLGRELRRRHPPATAVRPHCVVIGLPALDLVTRLFEAPEPLLIQALAAEFGAEALDVGVLRELARLVEDVARSLGLHSGLEGAAGELRPLVGSHGLRVASKPRHLVQQTHDVLTAGAVIDSDGHALSTDCVSESQVFDSPARLSLMKSMLPDVIDGTAFVQRHAFALRTLPAARRLYDASSVYPHQDRLAARLRSRILEKASPCRMVRRTSSRRLSPSRSTANSPGGCR